MDCGMTLTETDASEKSLRDRAFFGHPKGLGFLSFTEGCERFSYYSMQTLLVLYMVKYLRLSGARRRYLAPTPRWSTARQSSEASLRTNSSAVA